MSCLRRISIFGLLAVLLHCGVGLSLPVAYGAEAPHHDGSPPHSPENDPAMGNGPIDMNQAPIFPQNDAHMWDMIRLFIFSLVLFVGFVFLARTALWQPLIAALDQREAVVNQAKAEALAAKVGAEKLLAEHDAKMVTVREQVQEMIAKARAEAEEEKTRIVAEAEVKARQLRESAIADIHQARDQALSQLDSAVDAQVAMATDQIVGYSLS